VARQYDGQVTIVGIAGRDRIDRMQEFVERHGLDGVTLQVADVDGVVWHAYDVFYQPAWVFIDGDTGAEELVRGGLGLEGLEARVAALTG
jgi:hypothetical protein